MADDLSAERASELIGGIYDCALDPSLWPVALDRIRLELDFLNATLAVTEFPSFTPILTFSAGIPERWRTRMLTFGEDISAVWGGTARLMSYPLDEPIVLAQVADRAVREGSRYYKEWGRPQGIIDAVAIGFARDETMLGSIGMGRRGIGVPVRTRSGDPAVAHVLPLRRGRTGSGPRSGLLPRAVAAVFVAPAPERPLLPGDALAALYDLTPAEVRVMELIADGRTMAEIGQMIGVAVSTVKTHLQRVFAKTGCRRQVELANLVRSLRLPG